MQGPLFFLFRLDSTFLNHLEEVLLIFHLRFDAVVRFDLVGQIQNQILLIRKLFLLNEIAEEFIDLSIGCVQVDHLLLHVCSKGRRMCNITI